MVTFRNIFTLFLLLAPLIAFGSPKDYQPNKHIKKKVWEQVAPYLLPVDHPLKKQLDQLMKRKRVTLNLKKMRKAGFKVTKPRKWTHLVIATHPKLPGHIIKLYLDAQKCHKNLPDVHFWTLRCQGVQKIQKFIDKYQWNTHFKTPKKWIYPLPDGPPVPKGYHRKRFILFEEDMHLLNTQDNLATWKSSHVTKKLLSQLHTLLSKLGLKDCAKPDNIPFSTDGKIAFIDTQTHSSPPINFKRLTPHLSPTNQIYWKLLTN